MLIELVWLLLRSAVDEMILEHVKSKIKIRLFKQKEQKAAVIKRASEIFCDTGTTRSKVSGFDC